MDLCSVFKARRRKIFSAFQADGLYLPITGRRADSYHDPDSLVGFASIGDELILQPAASFSLALAGDHPLALAQENSGDNLVAKAARSLAALLQRPLDVRATLIKNLPVASGIGGGSSDAAAMLRGLAEHWGVAARDPRLAAAAKQHGQDVPLCLQIRYQ